MNVAIVGFGYWGPNYARLVNQLSGVNLKWVVDIDSSNFKGMKTRYFGVNFVSSISSVLLDKNTKAVIVCTPASSHYRLAKKLLENKKHVLIEKPLATSVNKAKRLRVLAKRNRLVLMVGHTFIYNSAIRFLKKYVQSGRLGKFYYGYCLRTNLGPVRHDVDSFFDLASHDISTFYYLFNRKAQKAIATGGYYIGPNLADVGFASVYFQGGGLMHMHVSWLDPVKTRKLVLVGSKKMVIFDDLSEDGQLKVIDKGFKFHRRSKNYSDFKKLSLVVGDTWIPRIKYYEPLKRQLKEFVAAVKIGKEVEADSNHGIEVVRVLEMIKNSERRHRL